MKHAGAAALEQLKKLLNEIRSVPGLKERKPGVFYRKSSGFLHFHEDPQGLFADLRVGATWERLPVNTQREKHALLKRIRRSGDINTKHTNNA